MPRREPAYAIDLEDVVRLWFHRQGWSRPRGETLTKRRFVDHLERTGGLQLDSVNVVDRAHYLTLWSRFGTYDRRQVDRWTYRDRAAFEHWGHEACVLPASRLPLSRRGMRRFRPEGPWWSQYMPSTASIRRVLKRLREEGPLESADFEKSPEGSGPWWGWKEDKRALELLWFQGRVAVSSRTHFRRAYDLAERVYGDATPASLAEYEDGWLLTGLSGNGVATEKHLTNYVTAPRLKTADRKRVIARNLRKGRVVEVEVRGRRGTFLARPEDLEGASALPAPTGTSLVCPFDSLLWQRERAEDLLGFRYRIEIYVPPKKRRYGYYVLPILHEGRLVGRLDPKLHRDRGELEIRSLHLEPGFERGADFDAALAKVLTDLAAFLGATSIALPRGWKRLLG
jgi:uncharacterized protein YcaQ